MLFTRCPDCDTTFRVTDEALKKANGQVRCGRCASVFNAYAERRELPLEPAPPESDAERAAEPPPAPAGAGAVDEPRDSTAESIGAASVAEIVAQVEIGVAAENAENAGTAEAAAAAPAASNVMSAAAVQHVLDAEDGGEHGGIETMPPPWAAARPAPRRSRWWAVAAVVASVALGAQSVHHFRAELVSLAVVGPLVQEAYGMLGTTVTPNWDVRQYEILDWVAAAEPNARGQGSLKITARIRNHGPQRQPYPAVHLRLKDRWEETVGSRVFSPSEYLPREVPRGRLMSSGETARAEIEVVDPGPDAYGFELDVCIEIETDVLSCRTDKIFL